ncbi:cytochrome P450 [Agrocybe pediades]|nr:cytochrome P450 [Agrocybe pediades]
MPTEFECETYHRWCQELTSDIIHLQVGSTSIVVLDSFEAATDLLEKRSSIYSGRPRMPMLNELMGWDFHFAFMDYDRMRPQLIKSARNILTRFLEAPDDVIANFRHLAGQTIMAITYGIQIQLENDLYVLTAEAAVSGLSTASVTGAFLVDYFPALKYVPTWFPGASFRRRAKEWRKLSERMVTTPYIATKKSIAKGGHPACTVLSNLQKLETQKDKAELGPYTEDVIQKVSGTMFTAATDTTVSTLSSFVLALVERPDIVRKAHAEIDKVVKPGHLPDFDDMNLLPYVTAIVKESLRWKEVLPGALTHMLKTDDEYRGYFIPAGTLVIPNAWAMLHDEKVYPDPFTFKPERFLKPDGSLDGSVRDPGHACWGFGRRICPGRYMAYSSVWITIATFLSVLDITTAVDDDGNVIRPTYEYQSALMW